MGLDYTVTREAVDEPEKGESGTIYEYVIRDVHGDVVARTFDRAFADWVKARAAIAKATGEGA